MRFGDLPIGVGLKKGVDELGYGELFPVQEQAIPVLLRWKDVIVQAKTGSGKTAAFGVSLVQMLDAGLHRVQALVLVPTRELALQVTSDVNNYAKYTPVRAIPVYGGVDIGKQIRDLERGVQIVVGTPGRVIDHLKRGTLKLDRLRFVVLDEADRMLDMGFIEDIDFIMRLTPSQKQVSLWSATIDDRTKALSRRYMRNPEMILVSKDEIAVEEIDQKYVSVGENEKPDVIRRLIQHFQIDRAMIFCQTRETVDEVTTQLQRMGFHVEALHGRYTQSRREQVLGDFRKARITLLVATEVAARGLDIEDVPFIINYEVPADPLMYFHRIGRTARAGKSGVAITLVTFREEEALRSIQALTSIPIRRMVLLPDFLL